MSSDSGLDAPLNHGYFLKYPEYSTGIRLEFNDAFMYRVIENVEKEPEDILCSSGEELLSKLVAAYPWPRNGYGAEPWGVRLFFSVFRSLVDTSRYYRRVKPALGKRARDKKQSETTTKPTAN